MQELLQKLKVQQMPNWTDTIAFTRPHLNIRRATSNFDFYNR